MSPFRCPPFATEQRGAPERVFEVNRIDLPRELKKLALPGQRSRIPPVDHLFALGSPIRPSVLDKNRSPLLTARSWRAVP